MNRHPRLLWFSGLVLFLTALPGYAPSLPDQGLSDVRTYMYQFQQIEDASCVKALAESAYDLLVVEPVGTYRSGKKFDMKDLVRRLRGTRPNRIVLAYLSLGEADSHRAYWESSWKEPADGKPGQPDFLLCPDPDGWKDTYVVRYWDPRWQKLLLADLRSILSAGFDGVCLDWADAYESPAIASLSNPRPVAQEMTDLVAKVKSLAEETHAGALLLLQNPSGLKDQDPRIAGLIDGVLYEHVWYAGKAETGWSGERGGDLETPESERESRLRQMGQWKEVGKPVFTLDYCLKAEHAQQVYERSRNRGFIPLVSRSALDRLTETPPPSVRTR